MRKITLLFLVLLNANLLFSQGQNPPKTSKVAGSKKVPKPQQPTLIAIYDYENQTYLNDELKPKHKQPVVLKIVSINKLAHNIQITESDVKIKDDYLDADLEAAKTILTQTKPVAAITSQTTSMQVEIPTKLVNESNNKTKSTASAVNLDALQTKINADKVKLLNLKGDREQKKAELEEWEADVATLENSTRVEQMNAAPDSIKIEKIRKEIALKKETLATLKTEIRKLDNSINQLDMKISGQENELMVYNDNIKNFKLYLNKINEKFHDIQMNLVNINRINGAYTNYINFIIIPTLSKKQYAEYAAKICTILDLEKRNEHYKHIADYEKAYTQFNQQYSDLFNSDVYYEVIYSDQNSAYSKLVKLNLENLKKEVERLNTLVNTTELRTKLHNVELFDTVLSSDNAFTVYSNPIQSFQDYLEFKVKITQNKNLGTSILKENEKEFTYTEYVRQSVRWDFSVGTVFDFGIKNQDYEIKSTAGTPLIPATPTMPEIPATIGTNRIIANNISEYTPTIAGLLHTSFRSNSMFAFGFSLGASIDLTKLNFNSFFPGVSLLIGKKEKLIFTVGPALKRVNQLRAIYQTDKDYTEPLQTENVTSPQFRTGWFAAISWNLTNKQKSKIIPQK